MAKIHHCTCRINLSGQNCHIVHFNEFNTVTWPEVQVLMQLHGDENVMDIVPVKIGNVVPSHEKDRLISLYGFRVVEACFPGRAFRMQLMMTDDDMLPHIEQPKPGNGGDEDDDGETEEVAAQAPVFKPGRHARPTPPEPPKEA